MLPGGRTGGRSGGARPRSDLLQKVRVERPTEMMHRRHSSLKTVSLKYNASGRRCNNLLTEKTWFQSNSSASWSNSANYRPSFLNSTDHYRTSTGKARCLRPGCPMPMDRRQRPTTSPQWSPRHTHRGTSILPTASSRRLRASGRTFGANRTWCRLLKEARRAHRRSFIRPRPFPSAADQAATRAIRARPTLVRYPFISL